MKIVNVFLFLTLFIISVSCSDDVSINKIGERVISTPKGVPAIISPVDSIRNEGFEGVGTLCCVADSVIFAYLIESPYVFRVINIYSKEYVDILAKGRGPDEIVSGQFSAKRYESGTTLVDITALNERIILSIDLQKTLSEKKLAICDTTKLLPTSRGSYIVGDQVLSKVVYDEDGPFYSLKLYDKNSLSVSKTDYIFGKDDFVANYDPLYASSNRVKPDGTRLCMGMLLFDEIEIYDIIGSNHKSCSISKKSNAGSVIETMKNKGTFSDHYFYHGEDVTNNYIYALYFDCEGSEVSSAPVRFIHVFSWDGILKDIYAIKEPLSCIIVSEDERTIYGLSYDEVLYKYVLGDISG